MLSFFRLDVFDEIWDVIESVSEGFITYSSTGNFLLLRYFSVIVLHPSDIQVSQYASVESSSLTHHRL